jgi:hypothetical protein
MTHFGGGTGSSLHDLLVLLLGFLDRGALLLHPVADLGVDVLEHVVRSPEPLYSGNLILSTSFFFCSAKKNRPRRPR